MVRLIGAALSCLAFASVCSAAPEIARLQTQKVGATTYFLVAVAPPKDLAMPEPPGIIRVGADHLEDFYFRNASEGARRAVLQIPRLVPLDDRTAAVHFAGLHGGKLVFVGKRGAEGPTASCRLFYPVEASGARGLAAVPGDREEAHDKLTLSWAEAKPVAVPERRRGAKRYPAADDLEGRHAWAQAMWFARMELRAPQAGLFGVSRVLTGKKYELWVDSLDRADAKNTVASGPDLFSVFTGGAHLDEAVMLRRLREPKAFEATPRTIPVDALPKVTLAEHDWKKMMAGKHPLSAAKPNWFVSPPTDWKKMMAGKHPLAEALAKLVPHDCYYLTTTSLASFASAWDVLDAWGGSVLRVPRVSDRDHGLRARYERQLCLPTAGLRESLGKKGFESAALVGSDLYWSEGSDVTVLFEPSDKKHLLATLDTLVAQTTKPFGAEVKVTHETHRGVSIDGWRTPRREISAYRAEVGGAVVCSNSPIAIRRIIDTHAGKGPSLGDSLDFRYMRTVFERDAKKEDGFVFLSDAFIRRLVNAPTRVKAMRRQQARATLALASHAALFAGHETGKLPADTAALLRDSGVEATALTVPDGGPVVWDGTRKQAISEVYGTLEHGTPLVELPIDKVTAGEREEFEGFQRDYMRLWVRFFDPVGIRFGLQPSKTKVEIYVLPLINSREYATLCGLTQGGLLWHDPRSLPADTVFQLLLHVDNSNTNDGMGDWVMLHLGGKGLKLDRLVRLSIAEDLEPGRGRSINALEEFSASRLTLGMGVAYLDKWAPMITKFWESYLKPERDATVKGYSYRTFLLLRIPIPSKTVDDLLSGIGNALSLTQLPPGRSNVSGIYGTVIDKGGYFSLSKKAIEDRIDFAIGRRKEKSGDTENVHAALYLAPPGGKSGRALAAYIDWRTHVKTQSTLAQWEGFYSAGMVTPKMTPADRDAVVRRLLGFVPVSGDGTASSWRVKEGRMVNEHHGTLAAPRFRGELPADAPMANLLRTLRSVDAGLRFREDGLHTTIRFDWGGRE